MVNREFIAVLLDMRCIVWADYPQNMMEFFFERADARLLFERKEFLGISLFVYETCKAPLSSMIS